MKPDWIFSITLTAINLVLSAANLYFWRKLDQANKEWRSNLNYQISYLMRSQARKHLDETDSAKKS